MAITCWYCGTAFIALLQANRIEQFTKEAQDGLDVLDRAVEQLQNMWASANVIRGGFERLRRTYSPENTTGTMHQFSGDYHGTSRDPNGKASVPLEAVNRQISHPADDLDWHKLFPFVTPSTSRIAALLLTDKAHGTIQTPADSPFPEGLWNQYQDMLQPFTDYTLDFSDPNFL
jgi:hypothetical protein